MMVSVMGLVFALMAALSSLGLEVGSSPGCLLVMNIASAPSVPGMLAEIEQMMVKLISLIRGPSLWFARSHAVGLARLPIDLPLRASMTQEILTMAMSG